MLKRFTCLILSLVLLVGLIPAMAIPASAASNATSSSAITILKKLETFQDSCSYSGGWLGSGVAYIGYGTKCTEKGSHTEWAWNNGHHMFECDDNGLIQNPHFDMPASEDTVAKRENYLLTNYPEIYRTLKLDGHLSFVTADGNWGNLVGKACPYTPAADHGAFEVSAHTIRETEASDALKEALKTIDSAINTFASDRGISLSQQQHDALAIFSFENGTGWTKGTDDLQNAVVTGMSGQDFVDVLTGWKSGDSNTRRRIEANMYLFGEYKTSDSSLSDNLKDAEDDDSDTADLVDKDRVKVTVTNDFINVREKASLYATKVGTVYRGDVLRIIRDSVKEKDGLLWGKYVDADYKKIGYVALKYTNYNELVTAYENQGSSSSTDDGVIAVATITAQAYVNVRSGAGTSNPIISALRKGDKVDLYQVTYVNGQKWGLCSTGWFSLAYASVEDKSIGDYTTNTLGYLSYRYDYKFATDTKLYRDDFTTFKSKTVKGSVKLANIIARGNETWAKVYVDGVDKGWVKVATGETMELTGTFKATYTTLTEVTVRHSPEVNSTRSNLLAKNTEFDITRIKADENTIWGYTEDANGKYQGWVDLSTKYVSRNGVSVSDESDSDEEATLATANLDVNIRKSANIFSAKVGTLAAGSTVEVLEGPKNGTRMTGWYRLDVENAEGTESWVRGDNLDIFEGTKGQITLGKTPTSPDGTKAATGQGMVANTYGGVNVRTAPGTANAKVTKLLPGTVVDILEVTYYGSTLWGKIEQGWVCMDYIVMMDYDDLGGVSFNTTVSSTKAIYEGKVNGDMVVYKEASISSNQVRTVAANDAVTVHELLTVSEVISDDGTTTVTQKNFWARVNDGYIPNPEASISLNDLYEQVYTVTETDLLKVRDWPGADQAREDLDLKRGDQVQVTEVMIDEDQFWGKIEHDDLTGGEGWICLSYCTVGAIDTSVGSGDAGESGTTGGGSTTTPVTMSTGNTGSGTTYAGTIIGSAQVQEVNVRKDTSTTSEKVTDLKKGTAVTITETRLVDGRSWGYCGSGWINLLYVDLTPVGISAIDAKIIAVDNTLVYESSETGANVVGSYANRAVVHIYSEMNGMYETDMGWIAKGNCL